MKRLLLAIPLIAVLCSCSTQEKGADNANNPLLQPSGLHMNAPEFSKIKSSDFMPAFEYAMQQQMKQIDSICADTAAATFQNTILPLELSGKTLRHVSNIFFALSSADGTEDLIKIESEISPKLSAHGDAIYLNDKLFQRVKQVYEAKNTSGEDARLTEHYYKAFKMAGAELNAADKEQLKKINSELATLTTQFGQLLTDATNAGSILVDSKEELSGLSESEIAAAAQAAKDAGHEGKYMLKLTNTTQQPQMASLDNRDVRRRYLEASLTRCSKGDKFDTSKIITQIAHLRAEKAKLLGFDSFSAWKLQDAMAAKPEAVKEFLTTLVKGYLPKAKSDAAELEAFAKKSEADTFHLQAYDWAYYAEKLRKEKYDLDENMIKPYFQLDSVLQNGVFYAANKLYGLTFKAMPELPVYNKDVRVFEVFDKDGSELALFYFDPFHRATKSGGAWMSNLQDQSMVEGTKPIIHVVCNYTKPAEGEPALLSFDELTTLFHEFGHALHGMFAAQQYATLSGTAVSRDFVEMPSQFNEHWATNTDVLKHYAKHYKTGEPMPQALLDKLLAATKFNQAYSLGENLAAVCLDMAWHGISADTQIPNVDEFEKNSLSAMNLYNPQIPPRYRSTYFRHIFANGYASGYYAYLWTEVLELNVYTWFMQHGGMTAENGQRFRDMILSKGNTEDAAKVFTDFTGLDKPNVEDLLKARGLK